MKKAITVLGLGAAAVAISVTNASASEQQVQNNALEQQAQNSTPEQKQAQTSTSINLREQPSATSNKVSKLQAGSKVTIKESQNGWANIQTEDGQCGWVSGYYVTDENGKSAVPAVNTKVNPVAQNNNNLNRKTFKNKNITNIKNNSENVQAENQKTSPSSNASSSAMGRVNSSVGLNVRSGAGINNKVISTLNNNDDVEILGEESGWYKVRLSNGTIGYVGAGYIAKTQGNVTNNSQGNVTNNSQGNVTNNSQGNLTNNSQRDNSQTDAVADKNKSGLTPTKASGAVAKIAQSLLGTRYSWGGTSTSGFDCSGFTQYVYKKALGIDIPRVSRAQASAGRAVSLANAIAGDLLYFDTMGSGTVSHVGIYLGNGKFIHASGTASNPEYVKTSSLSESWVKCLGARRF